MAKNSITTICLFFLLPFVALSASFDRDLYYGISSDPDVTRLQEFLTDQDVYSGPITGNFFTLTQEGVKRFQAREGIEPVLGYFGPISRTRANTLLASVDLQSVSAPPEQDTEALIAFLLKRIEELQATLSALQAEEGAVSAIPQIQETDSDLTDQTPPVFTKTPALAAADFLSDASIVDIRHAYKIIIEWGADETGITEAVSCTPSLDVAELVSGKATVFPEADTDYSCTVSIADAAGNESAEIVRFSTPAWLGVAGDFEQEFPPVFTTPLKLGDLTFYNGSSTDILLSRFTVDIWDEMDSVRNRNKKVYFVFKDGIDIYANEISKNSFTFILQGPRVGEPHTSRVDNFSFPVLIKAGEEKTVSLWIELLEYVRSGSLEVKLAKIWATSVIDPVGTFSFRLTKVPPL